MQAWGSKRVGVSREGAGAKHAEAGVARAGTGDSAQWVGWGGFESARLSVREEKDQKLFWLFLVYSLPSRMASVLALVLHLSNCSIRWSSM